MDTDEVLRKALAWIVLRGCGCMAGGCTCKRDELVKDITKELERY